MSDSSVRFRDAHLGTQDVQALLTLADDVIAKRNEKNYYISYYMGPEGGASKEILIEKRNGKWMVVNDDGMWIVK